MRIGLGRMWWKHWSASTYPSQVDATSVVINTKHCESISLCYGVPYSTGWFLRPLENWRGFGGGIRAPQPTLHRWMSPTLVLLSTPNTSTGRVMSCYSAWCTTFDRLMRQEEQTLQSRFDFTGAPQPTFHLCKVRLVYYEALQV